MWGRSEKVPSASQRERPWKQTNLPTPLPWTSGIHNCEKTNFCCLSNPVCSILLWQPELTNTDYTELHLLGRFVLVCCLCRCCSLDVFQPSESLHYMCFPSTESTFQITTGEIFSNWRPTCAKDYLCSAHHSGWDPVCQLNSEWGCPQAPSYCLTPLCSFRLSEKAELDV